MRRWLLLAALLPLAALAQALDRQTGLVVDADWELVRAHCTACHSARLVTQQRLDRAAWERVIRWMQKTQGLWELPPPVEGRILDYLARHYAPAAGARRAPLMPP
ncbi:MAG: hypothetical protein M3Z21_08755 [Pseudomonadota bacterium]|nr:hypothetical protein [Pseudomonadota bacterium]